MCFAIQNVFLFFCVNMWSPSSPLRISYSIEFRLLFAVYMTFVGRVFLVVLGKMSVSRAASRCSCFVGKIIWFYLQPRPLNLKS
jgi:hypothetical protein